MSARALVLFDIDGTLVRRAGPHHREALIHAVREVTGIATTSDGIPVHGMLDGEILRQMLAREGMGADEIAARMPAIAEAAQRFYVATCPDLRDRTCPGIPEMLDAFRERGIPLILVTGNLTRIGWKKLECAGLAHYFRWGAFADMAATRTELARIAIREAREREWITAESRISLVGDAPSDIEAAKANGVRSIAVYTGISTREELAALHPDILLADLRELDVNGLCA